jgi:hypothetical protein
VSGTVYYAMLGVFAIHAPSHGSKMNLPPHGGIANMAIVKGSASSPDGTRRCSKRLLTNCEPLLRVWGAASWGNAPEAVCGEDGSLPILAGFHPAKAQCSPVRWGLASESYRWYRLEQSLERIKRMTWPGCDGKYATYFDFPTPTEQKVGSSNLSERASRLPIRGAFATSATEAPRLLHGGGCPRREKPEFLLIPAKYSNFR